MKVYVVSGIKNPIYPKYDFEVPFPIIFGVFVSKIDAEKEAKGKNATVIECNLL